MSLPDMKYQTSRNQFLLTIAVLLLGLAPIPTAWVWSRSLQDSLRSNELNRVDREASSGGYYQGLIGVDHQDEGMSELAIRLLGKPRGVGRPFAENIKQSLENDILMFELKPNVNQLLNNEPFITNDYGMRDRPYPLQKPPDTFRIALLGSSIDMGWGIGTNQMYANELEAWLNTHAAKLGLTRRFEVLNFAAPAYSPIQRLESFRRKALLFSPDLVLYSATTLDTRLIEIHICDMLQQRVDITTYPFLNNTVEKSGVNSNDLQLNHDEKLRNKDQLKKKLRPHYWTIYNDAMSTLSGDCQSAGIPLAGLIIPRVGKADAPSARAGTVARLKSMLQLHTVAIFDLSDAFDDLDSADLEIGPQDDHPNALGHHRLFRALAQNLVQDSLYETLFDTARSPAPPISSVQPAPRGQPTPLLEDVDGDQA